jgi:hypothetical protein
VDKIRSEELEKVQLSLVGLSDDWAALWRSLQDKLHFLTHHQTRHRSEQVAYDHVADYLDEDVRSRKLSVKLKELDIRMENVLEKPVAELHARANRLKTENDRMDADLEAEERKRIFLASQINADD